MRLVKHPIDYSESSNTLGTPIDVIDTPHDITDEQLSDSINEDLEAWLTSVGQMAQKEEVKGHLITALKSGRNINMNGNTYRIYP